jgi:hypothetical protein
MMRTMVMLAALLATAAPVRAQQVATSMHQLRVLVRTGDDVEVTDVTGQKIRATIESVTDSSLELWIQGALKALAENDVATVRARRPPDLAGGARAGFVAGALFGIVPGAMLSRGTKDGVPLIAITSLIYGGLGAGIGAGIRAMIPAERLVYDGRARRSASDVRVAPMIAGDRKGVVVALGF